eukprot:Gb_12964 [translate_table: standard]
MASELLRYSLFDENVSENIFGSKAAADENKHGSSKIWRSDKGGDVFDIKRDHACLPVDETVSCNYDCWSNGHAEVVEGNWVLHDRGFISHVPKEKWKNEENLKGDHLDVEGLRQRGLFREEQDRETDLKSTFAAVSNWIEDLHLETGEFEAAARIEMENKQVDPKYWLGGHWDMGQPFAGSTCTSGGKPGNIIRENNLLLAEWGTHNPFWQKLEGDQVECQAISQHEDFKPNVSPSQFREKANQKYEEALSSPWTTVDITVGFHVPDSRYLSTVQGEDIDTWQGNNTNKRSVKIGDLGHEMDGTYKRFLSPSKEEMVGMLKQSTGGNMHEPAVEMGTLFEEISSVSSLVDPASGVVPSETENSFTMGKKMCMQADLKEPPSACIDNSFSGCSESRRGEEDLKSGVSEDCSKREAPGGAPHESILFTNSFTMGKQMCMQADLKEPPSACLDNSFSGFCESCQGEEDLMSGVSEDCSKRDAPGGAPHEAIFFTLSYLSLQDLFSVERVCKSLRAAVNNDVLLWRHLHVEHPLSKKLTDDALLQLSERAEGHLQCLSLVDCLRITDDGLKRVLDSSPKLTKLCLPGCTRISAEGIVKMVKGYRERKGDGMPGLKHLRIRGLYGITKEHLDNLKSYLDDGLQQRCESVKPQFYHNGHYSFSYDDDRSIDIEVCPKCGNARLVYDCTRERCQQKKDHKLQQCRGCIFCIARCEECGRCIDDNEYEETFCLDLLCSACWLQLPKCLECNRPGCGRHADHFIRRPDTSFVCGDCRGMSSSSLGPEFHVFA